MKKVKMLMIAILIIILIIIFIIIINKLNRNAESKTQEYNVIVKAILDNDVIVETPRQIRYIISSDNMTVYNTSGDKISVYNLKIGDTIYIYDDITNKNEKVTIRNIKNNNILADQIHSLEYKFSANEQQIWNMDSKLININDISIGTYIYVMCKLTNKTEIAKVKNIENDIITVDITYLTMYALSSKDLKIYDENNNFIDISDLDVGDNVYIVDDLIATRNSATIKKVQNNIITADTQSSKWYSFKIDDNKVIYDTMDNSLEISNLKVGDILHIVCEGKLNNLISQYLEPLQNIRLIKIVHRILY